MGVLSPSLKLSRKLQATTANFFLERCQYSRIALVIKAPTSKLRYLYFGANLYFAARRVDLMGGPFIWAACCIEDDANKSFYVSRIFTEEERALLIEFAAQESIDIYGFNELNHCSISLVADISIRSEKELCDPVIDMSSLNKELVEAYMDAIGERINQDHSIVKQYSLHISSREANSTTDLSDREPSPLREKDRSVQPHSLSLANQGLASERVVAGLLGRLFDLDSLFPSPVANKTLGPEREIIDLICVAQPGLIFFEVKAEQVVVPPRSMERRKANFEKDVRKAVKQLAGAARRVRMEGRMRLQNATICREVEIERQSIRLVVVVDEIYSTSAIDVARQDMSKTGDPICFLELHGLAEIADRSTNMAVFTSMIDQMCERQARLY
ncbi:hypothetical protein [Sphaerisporangium dianthi]|uniref:NERD domain-containing protein n=1 Tax=Sphaerisporangium dianthi TaxID=1436120 RepID=A0ABV9CRW9_9ACTN